MATCILVLANKGQVACHRWMRASDLFQLLMLPRDTTLHLRASPVGKASNRLDDLAAISADDSQWICIPAYSVAFSHEGRWIACIVSNRDPDDHIENCLLCREGREEFSMSDNPDATVDDFQNVVVLLAVARRKISEGDIGAAVCLLLQLLERNLELFKFRKMGR